MRSKVQCARPHLVPSSSISTRDGASLDVGCAQSWAILCGCLAPVAPACATEAALPSGGGFRFVGFLDWITGLIEASGVAIIVLGAASATLYFAWRVARSRALAGPFREYRANLGRGILLGLEFLVAADIIGTVAVDPTLQSLAVLAGIVLIRTFLSFSLEVEIEGRWPWQRGRADGPVDL